MSLGALLTEAPPPTYFEASSLLDSRKAPRSLEVWARRAVHGVFFFVQNKLCGHLLQQTRCLQVVVGIPLLNRVQLLSMEYKR